MEGFFTKAFREMEDKESFYQAVFMQDPSEYACRVRAQFYKSQLKFMGEGVEIGPHVIIENPQYISLGDRVTLSGHVTLIARGEGGITLGAGARLKERVFLDTENPDGYITVGNNVYIGAGTTLFGHKGLEIGEDSLLAQNITITPYSHIFEEPSVPIIRQGGHSKKVVIGRDCYLGMGVCVLYSGDIGEGSVVGSGAVVVKALPPYSVAVGNPARIIRTRGATEPKEEVKTNE